MAKQRTRTGDSQIYYSARLAAATEAVRLAEMERRLRLAQAEAEARVIRSYRCPNPSENT